MLFNLLVGFAFLFIIAFLLIKPADNPTPPVPELEGRYYVILTWEGDRDIDLDLWVLSPIGKAVGFRNRDDSGMHLDRDDLGFKNDSIQNRRDPDNPIVIQKNREELHVRQALEGQYVVAIHYYGRAGSSGKDESSKVKARVRLVRLNPLSVLADKEITMERKGEEVTAFAFIVDQNESVSKVNLEEDIKFVAGPSSAPVSDGFEDGGP